MERLPLAFYALVQIAFLFVHYPTTHRLPRIISFGCLLTLLFRCHTEYSLLSPGEDYVLGCTNGILVAAAAHITFFSPEFPNGLEPRNPTKNAEPGPGELPLAQKLSWMAGLAGNMRRIGFRRNGGAMDGRAALADVDKRGLARTRFVISRVILSALCLAVFQFTLSYRLQSPSFNPARRGGAGEDAMFIRASSSLLRRSREVVVWAMGNVSEMSLLQAAPAALSVAVGASEPEDWPPMFGSPVHAYSVGRFWSKGWHQVLRVPLGQSAAHLAQSALKVDRGTFAFRAAQVLTAFFASALIHTGGDYAIHGSFEKSRPTFQFFLLQPAAILAEEIAVRCALSTRHRAAVPELVWRGIGYLWVGLWFTWCAPPWLDAISAGGGNVRTRLMPLKMWERLA